MGSILQNNKKYFSQTETFKSKLILHIVKNIILEKISHPQLVRKITSNLENLIKLEYNTVSVPYFYILESINLSIEVEQIDNIERVKDGLKFGEVKFSEIQNGLTQDERIVEKFSISEKKFKKTLEDFTLKHTSNFSFDDEVLKIDLN